MQKYISKKYISKIYLCNVYAMYIISISGIIYNERQKTKPIPNLRQKYGFSERQKYGFSERQKYGFSERQKYGWYSASMENKIRKSKSKSKSKSNLASAFLWLTPDGKEVKVTLINDNPYESGYHESVKDVKFIGCVKDFVKQIH